MKISVNSDFKSADVIVSASITLSVEEARALYVLTETPTKIAQNGNITVDEDEAKKRNILTRDFVRSIAKKVLITSGNITPITDIIEDIKNA